MKPLIPSLLCACATALLASCASSAKYVSTGDRHNIVSVDEINIQDYIAAAEAATQKLLASGRLDRVPQPPAVLAISRIVNNTGSQIDTDLLTKKIRVRLNESGKAVTTTTEGLGGPEDPLAKERKQEAEALTGQPTPLPKSDFTLSGKIIETRARAGKVRQSTFSFQLSLTDNRGIAVWEGEEEITKQGSRPSVGF
jgi:hypothetical protein